MSKVGGDKPNSVDVNKPEKKKDQKAHKKKKGNGEESLMAQIDQKTEGQIAT